MPIPLFYPRLFWILSLSLPGIVFLRIPASGQTICPLQEVQLTSDNDVYLFDISDEYYSNGIQLDWRKVLPQQSKLLRIGNPEKPLFRKAIVGFRLNQSIYSPQQITKKNPDEMDRVYAGWLFGGTNLSLFVHERTVVSAQVEFGVTGPWSGAEGAQKSWHTFFQMNLPRNWDYQIRNAVHGQAALTVQRELHATQALDLLSETAVTGGSLLTNIRQGFTLRLGNREPLYHSLYTHSRLDRTLPETTLRRKERYVFFNTTLERVVSNGLIDGELQHGLRLHTAPSLPWVMHYQVGLHYGGNRAHMAIAVQRLSAEFRNGGQHHYGSLALGFRF